MNLNRLDMTDKWMNCRIIYDTKTYTTQQEKLNRDKQCPTLVRGI